MLKQARSPDARRTLLARAEQTHPLDYFYALAQARLLPLKAAPGGPSPRLHALNRALRLCPGCDTAHVEVARNLWKLGLRPQALLEWRTAIDIQPTLFTSVVGELYMAGAKPEELAAIASTDVGRVAGARRVPERARTALKEAFVVLDQASALGAPSWRDPDRPRRPGAQGRPVEGGRRERRGGDRSWGSRIRGWRCCGRSCSSRARAANGADAALPDPGSRRPFAIRRTWTCSAQRIELVVAHKKWNAAPRSLEGLKLALFHHYGSATDAHIWAARIDGELGRWNKVARRIPHRPGGSADGGIALDRVRSRGRDRAAATPPPAMRTGRPPASARTVRTSSNAQCKRSRRARPRLQGLGPNAAAAGPRIVSAIISVRIRRVFMQTYWFVALISRRLPGGPRTALPAVHTVGGLLLSEGRHPPLRLASASGRSLPDRRGPQDTSSAGSRSSGPSVSSGPLAEIFNPEQQSLLLGRHRAARRTGSGGSRRWSSRACCSSARRRSERSTRSSRCASAWRCSPPIQFAAPPDASVNMYSVWNGEEVYSADMAVVASTGRARVASTFAYVTGFVDFTILVPTLLLSLGLDAENAARSSRGADRNVRGGGRRADVRLAQLGRHRRRDPDADALVGGAVLHARRPPRPDRRARSPRRCRSSSFPEALQGVQSRFENQEETNSRFEQLATLAAAGGDGACTTTRSWASGRACSRTRRPSFRITTKWDVETEVGALPRRARADRVPADLVRQARADGRVVPKLQDPETRRAARVGGRGAFLRSADDHRQPRVRSQLAGAVLHRLRLHPGRGRQRPPAGGRRAGPAPSRRRRALNVQHEAA